LSSKQPRLRPETPNDVSRPEFLRRTGALGIAAAAQLGFPLLEARRADAAPLPPARDVIAAGGRVPIVRIGHIDGFTGVYAAASESQHTGLQQAVEDANRKYGSKVQFEIVRGDDTSAPIIGKYEARRLIEEEHVDVLMGCLSSGVGLVVSAVAQEHGVIYFAVGTHDTNITGPKANRCCFRTTCSNSMLVNAVAPPLLREGKKWFFVTADYAFGNDAHVRFRQHLLAAPGGVEVGEIKHKLGETDYDPIMQRISRTDSDVLVFCNYGPDTLNSVITAVKYGLNKRMRFGGILSGNEVVVGMPTDEIVGSLFGYIWGPEAKGYRTPEIYAKLKARAKSFPPNWRQYLGFVTGEVIADRIVYTRTTDSTTLIKALEDYHYDSGKGTLNYLRACDHQSVQETYAGRIVERNRRRSPDEFFEISSTIDGDTAAGNCENPDSKAAETIFAKETVPAREDYTPVGV
jgi:branched-chain amino acid transport system substrate-binding protein